jgi:hypothetical protein
MSGKPKVHPAKTEVSGQSARVIVDHSGQPRSDWLAARVSNEHVELRVIGLPDLHSGGCAVAMYTSSNWSRKRAGPS